MDTKGINAAVKCAVETTQQPPSFFIHGSSVFALETEAVKTAETLKRCENMFFRGIVKYFLIKMPYFSDMAGSEKFLARLDESMNTAADFYSEFKGVVNFRRNGQRKASTMRSHACRAISECINAFRTLSLLKRKRSRHRLTI